jgi:SAM-dependent methyltransferase
VNSKFEEWLSSEAGQSLVSAELVEMHKFMRQVGGPVVAQLGEFGGADLLEKYEFPVSVIVSGESDATNCRSPGLRAAVEALPFQDAQISSIICPHVLEYANDPHQVLREIKRVLRPEGHVLLTGFNPWSLLSPGKSFRRAVPWHGRLISFARLSDWLRLLELEITGSGMFFYSLGFTPGTGRVSQLINAAGDRWWPLLGGVYILVARKREIGMTLIGGEVPGRLHPSAIRGRHMVRRNQS